MPQDILADIRNSLPFVADFFWRNSNARLNLNFRLLPIDDHPPAQAGEVTMDPYVADLRALGVRDNQYSAIHVTGMGTNEAGGPGIPGNWGGFVIFGQTGGSISWSGAEYGSRLPDVLGPAKLVGPGFRDTEAMRTIQVERVAPALFSANADGHGVAAAFAIFRYEHSQEAVAAFQPDRFRQRQEFWPIPIATPAEGATWNYAVTGLRY